MRIQNRIGHRLWRSALVLQVLLTGACAELVPASSPLQDHAIRVTFSGDCPTAVDPAVLDVRWRERIRWESVSGPKDFKVHLGPFQRNPLPSEPAKGRTLWTKVEVNPDDFDVDELAFTYSITARGCASAIESRVVVR